MNGFWLQHQVSLLVFLGVILLIALSNLWALRRLGYHGQPPCFPSVSVLVPARNEAANIGPCLRSLLAQEYPDFEILVLDDDSSDETEQIASSLIEGERLRVLRGESLPEGWLGKHWACHQLARAAHGELLLFTDADTRHQPCALRDAVSALLAERADLVSALPRQEMNSFGERLLVPIIPWSLMSFWPFALVHRLSSPTLSAAIGQFMLFRRQAYDQIGGHAAVRRDVVDDLALARRIKAHRLRLRLVDADGHVSCHMYHGFRQAYYGLAKNLFAIFGNAPLLLFVWLWLALVFWEPLFVLALWALGTLPKELSPSLAAGAVAVSFVLWSIVYRRCAFPLYLVFLYPLTILLTLIVAVHSMALAWMGKATWKGRVMPKAWPSRR